MKRFNILKSSWGIAIFYEIEELYQFEIQGENIYKIESDIFIEIDKKSLDTTSFNYILNGVKSIKSGIAKFPICLKIKVDYNICDFQPEGMYYMFRKWYFEHHDMEVPEINVYFDKEKNKYVFPDLIG